MCNEWNSGTIKANRMKKMTFIDVKGDRNTIELALIMNDYGPANNFLERFYD